MPSGVSVKKYYSDAKKKIEKGYKERQIPEEGFFGKIMRVNHQVGRAMEVLKRWNGQTANFIMSNDEKEEYQADLVGFGIAPLSNAASGVVELASLRSLGGGTGEAGLTDEQIESLEGCAPTAVGRLDQGSGLSPER